MQVVTQGLCGSNTPVSLTSALTLPCPPLRHSPHSTQLPMPQISGLLFLLSFLKVLFVCNIHTPASTDVRNVSGFVQSFFFPPRSLGSPYL